MARNGLASRVLRALGSLLLGAVVILGVALAFFPFERLAPVVVARIERETRARASLDRLSLGFSWRGPHATFEGLALLWPDGSALALDTLRVAPALSLAWLRGAPAARITSAAAFGAFDGVASLAHISGELRGLNLAKLPAAWLGGSAPIEGTLDAQVDATHVAEQWGGEAKFSSANGVFALPGMPVEIPYESLRGRARLDAVGNLSLDSVSLRGPLVSAVASGSVAAGYAGPATGALDLTIDVERIDPALAPMLAEYGLPLSASGAGRIHVGGTPDQIEVR